jgi:heme/copper-type cytochrome/quinol oxidase subunit 1
MIPWHHRYQYKGREEDKMMSVLETVYKFVGIISNLIGIINQITTYRKGKEKDPSGSPANDGSKDND